MQKILGLLSVVLFSHAAFALPLTSKNWNGIGLSSNIAQTYDFEGIVGLSNCSGSIIQFENEKDTDQAKVLTNGHCFEGGFTPYGQVVVDVDSDRDFSVLDPSSAQRLGTITADKVLYSTMTKTDITIYRVVETYAEIKAKFNVRPLLLSSTAPTVGTSIDVVSGFWKQGYSCSIEAIINKLQESDWTWEGSLRYSRPGCEVIGGTSGSPVVQAGTRTVIGINNTGNDDGEKCTLNNPCEIDGSGNISYVKGYSYAEETYWIYSCLNEDFTLNLQKSGCLLPH